MDGLKTSSGDRFIENLERIIRENSKVGEIAQTLMICILNYKFCITLTVSVVYNNNILCTISPKDADDFVTPIKDDRRQDRETPAKRMRRKMVNYRDLDRPSEGPDLRKDSF